MAQTASNDEKFTLEDASRSFKLALRAERRAPRTIALYLSQLVKLEAFLADHGLPTALHEIKRDDLRAYFANESERLRIAITARLTISSDIPNDSKSFARATSISPATANKRKPYEFE